MQEHCTDINLSSRSNVERCEVAKPTAPECLHSLYLVIDIRKQVKDLNSDFVHRNAFSFTFNHHNIFSKELYSYVMNTDMQDS